MVLFVIEVVKNQKEDFNMFLPISKADMKERGIERLDFIYVIGDAYVDHSSFGHAIISRVLEHAGYSVGIISQPDWHSCEPFKELGEPRLGFLVSAGNIDSMVNHYTVSKKVRGADLYSPGGAAGKRPDRATIVYCNRIREAFGKNVPIIIGGIEASLRRFAHYDYWSDKVRRSILIDSSADLLIYGMGEHQIVEIADLLDCGTPISQIKHISGTAYIEDNGAHLPENSIFIPSYDEVSSDKQLYAKAAKIQYEEQDFVRGAAIIQKDNDKKLIVQLPPSPPLTTEELDEVYELPYEGTYHPSYEEAGGIPAIKEIEFSITSCRGCFGGCNFCALAFHQGRTVTSRSHDSIIREATLLTKKKNFKGYIHDVGGPTANFRAPSCSKQLKSGVCKSRQCLSPTPCKNLEVSHRDYIDILRKLRKIQGVKKVFVRSGIRFDYLIEDKDDTFLRELCKHHISGQLRVAPEHISDNVLKYMGKPSNSVYEKFIRKFNDINKQSGKDQYIVPYLMSSHPGSTLNDAVSLAEYLHKNHLNPKQVQDFYPTPGSISTCMYYTGIDPRTMKKVYVPQSFQEKQMQRALLQYNKPENYRLVFEALKKTNRLDLVGYGPDCLIKPPKGDFKNGNNSQRKNSLRKNKRGNETGGKLPERKRNNPGSRRGYRG